LTLKVKIQEITKQFPLLLATKAGSRLKDKKIKSEHHFAIISTYET
jgi:hypothetical protein